VQVSVPELVGNHILSVLQHVLLVDLAPILRQLVLVQRSPVLPHFVLSERHV
jgi:hypothetical protein